MKTHRNIINIAFNIYFVFTLVLQSLPVPGLATLAVSVFQGCSKQACSQDGNFTEEPLKTSVKSAVHYLSDTPIRSIDALVFNNDIFQTIDCYQRFDSPEETLNIGSCGGSKIFFLCANARWNKEDWMHASSFNKIHHMKVNLESEDRSHPIMCAEISMKAGDSKADVKLERLSSMVGIRSISCNFKGRPYNGETITDARAYLININGTSSLTPFNSDQVERIINHRELIHDDIKAFSDSSLVISHLGIIGLDTIYPDTELICYPNTCVYEDAGTQFTRLVVEGKISGHTWYWPIDINRNAADAGGIERNMRYMYDIVITRKGTKDPNIPINLDMAEIAFEAERWTEKEEYKVAF